MKFPGDIENLLRELRELLCEIRALIRLLHKEKKKLTIHVDVTQSK